MEKYDNTIETASIMRTENGNGFGWWMERCLKKKKKEEKRKALAILRADKPVTI